MKPHSLHELRLWLVGSEEMRAAVESVCVAEVLRPAEWRDRSPALLLVEAAEGVDEIWGDELERLLDHCRAASIPCLLWVTASPLGSYWLARCRLFDRVFTVDRGQVPELEAAGARDPWVLWPATAIPPDEPGPVEPTERPHDVVWLGGWSPEWPEEWRERLASVLSGVAEHSLCIVAVEDLEGLPADLRQFVAPPPRNGNGKTALLRAKAVVGADPRNGSPLVAPQVVFDAAVCGAAVVTPHDFASLHDFAVGGTREAPWRNLVPVVHDGEAAVAEIGQLLDDDPLRGEVVSHMRRIAANNHTYAHRVATLASAAGYRLVPDPLASEPS
jgi:hypothetical protein